MKSKQPDIKKDPIEILEEIFKNQTPRSEHIIYCSKESLELLDKFVKEQVTEHNKLKNK